MNIVLQRLLDDKGKVRALGTITIIIFPLVLVTFDGIGEQLFRFVDLHPDLWQIGQLHGGAIFIDQCFQVDAVKIKIVVFYGKSVLRKVEGLSHQVGVRIILIQFI